MIAFTFAEIAAASDPQLRDDLAPLITTAQNLIKLATETSGTQAEMMAARLFADHVADALAELREAV